MRPNRVSTVVGGYVVTCTHVTETHRVWRCDCADYARTVAGGEGFCPHTALAIQRAIEEGKIALTPL
jgi:hypothetical protein